MADIIAIDVECPWCGAKSGELCTEGSSNPPYVQKIYGRGHLARTKPVDRPDSTTESDAQQGQGRGRV